jgi:heat shock protein HtpX
MSKNTIKTVVLLAAIGGLFMLVGQLLGGTSGLTIGLLLGLGLVGFSYWFSDTVAIKAARAVPVTEAEMPEYYAIVRDLTTRANMPMPKLYVTPDRQPNAFATGRNPNHAAVAVTKGILEICTWDELRGVLAHEISHVGNRDILIATVAAGLASMLMILVQIAQLGALFGFGRDDDGPGIFELLMLMLLGPLAAGLLQAAISRSREYQADASGAELTGDPLALASALRRIEAGVKARPLAPTSQLGPASALMIANPFAGGSMLRLFSTHPATNDRVARLEAMAGRGITR